MRRYKHFSLGYICKDENLLLGFKKRGWGRNYWNGFGGKVEEDKDGSGPDKYDRSLVRECKEEFKIDLLDFRKKVILLSSDDEEPDLIRRVDTYEVLKYAGTPVETEELRPQWFNGSKPYNEMWAIDRHWLPQFLEGKEMLVYGHYDSAEPGKRNLLKRAIEYIPSAEDIQDRDVDNFLDSLPKSS